MDEFFIFSASDSDELFTKENKPDEVKWDELDNDYRNAFIPREFKQFNQPVRLTTAREFNQIPDLKNTSLIH